MYKKFNNHINELIALGVRDIEQSGSLTLREKVIKNDGSEFIVPPAEVSSASLNLRPDGARIQHKMSLHHMVKRNKVSAVFFSHDRIFFDSDGFEAAGVYNIYILGIAEEGTVFVKEVYFTNLQSGELVLAERAIQNEDPEESQWAFAALAEKLVSISDDEQFAAIPQEEWADGLPQEWIDYVYRERQNRDPDEWESRGRAEEEAAVCRS